MWWQATKTWFKTAFSLCKKYWQIIVGFVAAIFLFIVTRKTPDPREVLKKSNEAHDAELEAIKRADEAERAAREEAVKKHEDAVAKVEKAFEEANEELTKKKRKQVNKIIKENVDDPDAITKKLSELTGFKIQDSLQVNTCISRRKFSL